ncbi:hypothetical protein GCM10027091_39020 [Streptomyces daliensis]
MSAGVIAAGEAPPAQRNSLPAGHMPSAENGQAAESSVLTAGPSPRRHEDKQGPGANAPKGGNQITPPRMRPCRTFTRVTSPKAPYAGDQVVRGPPDGAARVAHTRHTAGQHLMPGELGAQAVKG